jgi:hypothetical protein
MKPINITTQLKLNDFIKITRYLHYQKISSKYFTAMGVFIFLTIPLNYSLTKSLPYNQLIIGLIVLTLIPIILYFSAKKNFRVNSRLQEKITYTFDESNISLQGDSFNSQLSWDKIYKVTENKSWILIWQNKQVANIIPKRDFNSSELDYFKEIVFKNKTSNKLSIN